MKKTIIHLKKENNLKYTIEVKDEKAEIPHCFRNVYGEKIDNRYLLRKDTSGKADKIFGISDTPKETEKRLYNVALEIVNKEKEFYSSELLHYIIIINDTPQANQLELKFKHSN